MSRRRWRRGATEGFVVLASILVAFWIDAWWDSRQERRLETEILELVSAEIEANRSLLQFVLADNDQQSAAIDWFLRASPDSILDMRPDSVASLVRALQRVVTFNPNEEAATLLTQTPIVSSESLGRRAAVARYLRGWADASEEHPILIQLHDDVMRGLAPYAEGSGSEGLGTIPVMTARQGPAILVDMRTDERLMSTVILKAQWVAIYQSQLRGVLASLDSAAVAFR